MKKKEIFDLPYPTNQTRTGPKLRSETSILEVEYDFEKDNGSLEIVKIYFQRPIAFEFRQETVCIAEDLDAYNKIVKYLDSNWLLTVRERWRIFFGNLEESSNEFSFAHWKVYFDDVGCVDVIAESFTIT